MKEFTTTPRAPRFFVTATSPALWAITTDRPASGTDTRRALSNARYYIEKIDAIGRALYGEGLTAELLPTMVQDFEAATGETVTLGRLVGLLREELATWRAVLRDAGFSDIADA